MPTEDQAADEALYRHATKTLSSQPAWISVAELAALRPGKSKHAGGGKKQKERDREAEGEAAQEGGRQLLQQALVIVSDDGGFAPLLEQAAACDWATAVVCSAQDLRKFEAHVDAFLPWSRVCADSDWYD